MKISGYNISVQPGKIIFRANAWRLFQGFLGKVLALPLSVVFVFVAHHMWNSNSLWGVAITGILAIVCFILSAIPEPLRFEFERFQITRFATRWGFPVVRAFACTQPLRIKCSHHTPSKGFVRSVQLSVMHDRGEFEIIAISGASRESLDMQVGDFRSMLEKELKIKSELV